MPECESSAADALYPGNMPAEVQSCNASCNAGKIPFYNPAPGDLQAPLEGRRLETTELLPLQALVESGALGHAGQIMFNSHHNLVEDFFSDAHCHMHIEDFCSFVEEDRGLEPFARVTRSFFASGPQFGPFEGSGARRLHAQHTWPRREQARTHC